MNGPDDRVKNTMVEILAIKLYEHSRQAENVRVGRTTFWPPDPEDRLTCWADPHPEDRELYRGMARGRRSIS